MTIHALTIAEFRLMLPEFSNVLTYTDAYVDQKLIEAFSRVSEEFLGEQTSYAHGYMTGHLITKFPPAGAGGSGGGTGQEVKSVSAGGASISYVTSVERAGASTGRTRDLETTKYGLMFLEIAETRPRPYTTYEG